MQRKTTLLLSSFALSAILVVGTMGFSTASEAQSDGSGMMNMMGNDAMNNMMEAMNSPEGQEMMAACNNFMSTYEGESKEDKEL